MYTGERKWVVIMESAEANTKLTFSSILDFSLFDFFYRIQWVHWESSLLYYLYSYIVLLECND